MLFSGADLIRTSGHNADRAQRLKAVPQDPAVKAVESPGESKSSLDEQTQSALLRFARFVNKEGNPKKPKSNKKAPGNIPKAYISQAQNVNQDERSGGMLNIYA